MTGKALVLACVLASCAGAVQPAPTRTVDNTVPASAVDAEPVSLEQVVRDLATGNASFVNLVDTDRGVLFAEYFVDPSEQDPRAIAGGLVSVAARLCGAELADRLAELERTLAAKLRTCAGIHCAGGVCTADGIGEFDQDAALRFEPIGDETVLLSVVEIEAGPVTEEFLNNARAWVEQALGRLREGSCSQ